MSLRNIRHEAFSLSGLERILEMVSPATEKTLSDGAEVAGMQSTFLAIWQSVGKFSTRSFYHVNGSMYLPLSPFSNVSLISILSIDFYALSSAVTAR